MHERLDPFYWSAPDAAVSQAIVEASRAVDAEIDIPLSDRARERGFDYFGFQRAGIKFMTTRPATLLADDMGVGKTIQIIGAANVTGAERIVIVCPASMLLTWAREMFVWLVKPLRWRVVLLSHIRSENMEPNGPARRIPK